MEVTLVISNIVSWIAIALLTITVYALSRQIGVLHERIKPVGALALGKSIQVGESAPLFQLPSLNGGAVQIGGQNPKGKASLVFFTSSSCPVCKTIIPILKSVDSHEQDWLQIIFASDGVDAEHLPFIKAHKLERYPYLLSAELGMAYQVSKLPYAVLISPEGRVSAHGLINNREHLESLFELHRQNRSKTLAQETDDA